MLKKSIILLSFLMTISNSNCASGGANLANSHDPSLKEIRILTDILNRNKIITPFQRNKFTEKLEHFLRNYEGSDKTFNIWKQIVEKGAAVSDPLLETCLANPEIRTSINSLVIGKNWTDELLKIELSQINIRNIFNALPYLDILTKTNAAIDFNIVIDILFENNIERHSIIYSLALAYCCVQSISHKINAKINNDYSEPRHDTLLSYAIKNNSSYAVKKLLQNTYTYAAVNPIIDNNDSNAFRYREATEYEPAYWEWNGICPLEEALFIYNYLQTKPNPEIIAMLLGKRALLVSKQEQLNNLNRPILFLDITRTNAEILTYIYSLIQQKNYEALDLLLKNFDIAKADPLALIKAVKNQNEKLITVLIRHDFNVNIKDSYGKTAMDYAKELKNEKIISLLKLYQLIPPTFLERLRGIGTKASV